MEETEDNYLVSQQACVNVESFEELHLDPQAAGQAQAVWDTFLARMGTRGAAGEAIYQAIFDGVPSLQSFFKTPRAVQAMRFVNSLAALVAVLGDATRFKAVAETLAFWHLQLEVTIPRVLIFKDAIMDMLCLEVGEDMTESAREVWSTMLNYIGGAIIFVRKHYAERLQIIADSWRAANDRNKPVLTISAHDANTAADPEQEDSMSLAESGETVGQHKKHRVKIARKFFGKTKAGAHTATGNITRLASKHHLGNAVSRAQDSLMPTTVPTVYPEMFHFNAEVMGFGGNLWFDEVLAVFDNIVSNVSNSARMQEECDVLAIRIANCSRGPVVLPEYKACMLAALRSLLPKQWSPEHEVAWTWLWDTVQNILEKNLANPVVYEEAITRFFKGVDEERRCIMRNEIYASFFETTPMSQNYFKQSSTRLHFIADRVLDMAVEFYHKPTQMVDDISAMGLRHVGYGIPTELFGPYVATNIQVVSQYCSDNTAMEAYRWSLSLISQILVRTITEGSTIVMQAINANSAKQLQKAIACAPRGERAQWMLTVRVGTQSISPLKWSIESGSLEAARAMIIDLLTFRSDRETYYYGADELFLRHPDIIRILCSNAPMLLPTLLDGLIWRSNTTRNGVRRVNFYVAHLLVAPDGGVSKSLQWLAASKDATVISHPVLVLISDTLWKGIVQRQFVFRKFGFIVSLIVFLMTQSILPKFVEGLEADDQLWLRIAIFAGRLITYTLGMGRLLRHHTHHLVNAYRHGDIACIFGLRYPTYWQDPYEVASFLLTFLLIAMCCLEPTWRCMGNEHWPTQACPEAAPIEFSYDSISMIAMALHWALLIDMGVFSTKLSAFVLVCGEVISEVTRFLVALVFLLLTFGSAIACLRREHPDFKDVPTTILSLFSITLLMMPRDYRELQDDPALLITLFVFVTASVILLINLLIAQLNCSYEYIYQDMVGNARLQRVAVIVETLATVSEERWRRFAKSLRLHEKVEFNEGDVGLAGAVQVHEPASLNPITAEMIHRYGGTCSPELQWPEEKVSEDRFDRLNRLISRALKRATRAGGGNQRGERAMGSGGSSFTQNTGLSSTVISVTQIDDMAPA